MENNAREVVIAYWEELFDDLDAEKHGDHLLAWLWAEGYKIVPI